MSGLSSDVVLAASAVVLLATIVLVVWLNPRPSEAGESVSPRLDLLRVRMAADLVRWRPLQFVARLPFVFIFLFIIIAGFFGSQTMGRNIAPVITWTIWWAALIIVIPFLGKIWCFVCPWNAIAEWVQRFTFWSVKPTSTSLGLSWPKSLRNLYPAIVLFIVLTWLELGVGVTTSAWATAGLGVLILILTILPAMYFDRKPFCRYACPVGMVSGAYAQLAVVEVRPRDQETCRACQTKDCLKGNQGGYGCPVSMYLGNMDRDVYCIQCTECAKSCRHGNVGFNLRAFASSVIHPSKLRLDEACAALSILGLTFFHSVAMTPNWAEAVHGVHLALGGSAWALILAFTAGMLIVVAVPGLVYLVGIAAAGGLSTGIFNLRTGFVGFAYALLPLALFYHLAHNLQHLLREGQRLVPLLSDPLGRGWNLFGTAGVQLGPLAMLGEIQLAQAALVVIGHAYGIYIAYRIARAWGIHEGGRLRTLLPMVIVLVVLSLANLWLLSMPMQLRMGEAMPGHTMPGSGGM